MRGVPNWLRWVGGVTGALVVPFALLSAYMLSAGPGSNFGFPVFVLSVLAGAACLAALPVDRFLRVAWVVVYLPLVICAAILYTLMFAGVVFNEWI